MKPTTKIFHDAIGLIGLPNSGKTAFIYATGVSHNQCEGWRLSVKDPSLNRYLAQLRRSEGGRRPAWQNTGSALPHTAYKLFNARRRGILAAFIQPPISVSVPDMPGELILKAAGRGVIRDEKDQQRVDNLLMHLRECSGLLCLIDPTLPDGDVSEQAEDLANVISQVINGRSGRKPLALSIALTKLDVLLVDPRRSTISLPQEDCLRLAHVKSLGLNPTSAGIVVARGKATYNLIDAEAFRGADKAPDREHDAAVVWDYMNMHLPAVARAARAWAEDGRATVRTYMISNWGQPAPQVDGREVVPTPNEIRPIRLMEPVRSVLDRVGRDRRDKRLNSWLKLAAAIILPLALLGPAIAPATTWYANSRMDKGDIAAAERALRLVDYHPILQLDEARDPQRLTGLADANLRLARTIAPPGDETRSDADYDTAFAAVDRALQMAPSSSEAAKWQDLLALHIDSRIRHGQLDGALHLLEVSVGSFSSRPAMIPVFRNATDALYANWRQSLNAALDPTHPAGNAAALDQVDQSLGRLKKFLLALRHADNVNHKRGNVVDDEVTRLVNAATARAEATGALLALARKQPDESKKQATEAEDDALLAGADGKVALAEAEDAMQRVGRFQLDRSLNLLKKAADGAPAALPGGAQQDDAEYYPQLMGQIRSAIEISPALVHRADDELRQQQTVLWSAAKKAITEQAPTDAVAATLHQKFRCLRAIEDARVSPASGSAGQNAIGAIELAEALFAYERIEQGVLAANIPAPAVAQPIPKVARWLAGESRPTISVTTTDGPWVLSDDVFAAQKRVDVKLTDFFALGLVRDVDDKQLEAAVQVGAAVEPSEPLKRAMACGRLYLAVAREAWLPGKSEPRAEIRDLYTSAIKPILAQNDVEELLVLASRRLLKPTRPIESAFALRQVLSSKRGDLPTTVDALIAVNRNVDQAVLQPRPTAIAAERWTDLLNDYLALALDEPRAGEIYGGLIRRIRSPQPPPELLALWPQISRNAIKAMPEADRERIFAADIEKIRKGLAVGIPLTGTASVVDTGLADTCAALGADRARKAALAATRLEQTVRTYQLLLVQGTGDQAAPGQLQRSFYLGRHEFTFGEYKALVQANHADLMFAREDKFNGHFEIDGKGEVLGTGYTQNDNTRGNDPTLAAFAIPYEKATAAADAAGGRLPTDMEWQAAFRNRPILDPPTDALSNAKTEAELQKVGDVTVGGEIGMRWGVREWVVKPDGTGVLLGTSWLRRNLHPDAATQLNPNDFTGLLDVGFRLAADVLPGDVEGYGEYLKQNAALGK